MKRERRPTDLATDSWAPLTAHPRQLLALILSDDVRTELRALTAQRCKAALPFAGKYRLIDFALSNCVNSGIGHVGVITQYRPRSLHAHLAHGRPWDLDRQAGGLTVLHPYQTRIGMDWYTGTADAIYQNQEFIFRRRADDVLILPGDQAYGMDLNALGVQHRRTKADLTIAVVAADEKVARRHHTVVVDDEGWIRTLIPPAAENPGALVVMGVLLFSTDVLSWRLSEDAQRSNSTHDLIRDVLPAMIEAGDRAMTYHHTGHWNTLQTVYDYWRAHMHLLGEEPDLNLQDAAWPIHTRSEVRPPTRVSGRARVSHSMLSEGCVVDGTVEHSVLSPGVHVAPGAIVRNAIVMHNTIIEERAIVENAILDADVIIGSHARVGQLRRQAPTLGEAVPEPLAVVTRGVHIPAHQAVKVYGLIGDQATRTYGLDVSDAQVETTHRYLHPNN